jgi:hypothetical protein
MEYVLIGNLLLPVGLFGDASMKYGKTFEYCSKGGEVLARFA